VSHILTHAEFLTVRRRLAGGIRHADIARELNLSIWTIARVADRRRFLPAELDECEIPTAEMCKDELCEDDGPPDYVAKSLRRCPGCGAMVYVWPCIACGQGVSTSAIAPPQEEEEDEVEIELRQASAPADCRRKTKQRYRKQKLQSGRRLVQASSERRLLSGNWFPGSSLGTHFREAPASSGGS
jgi:hypothetical protein